jgi:diaminopimelate epimerase
MTGSALPGAGRRYFKAHGLGNDYLVFTSGTAWTLHPAAVQAVCHRWEGVGSDGIVLELPPVGAVRRLRMFNPDGSEFERSGNGLRVYATFLASTGMVGDEPFRVEVGGGVVGMRVHGRTEDGEHDVSVEMGQVSFDPAAVDLDSEALDDDGRIRLPAGPVAIIPVSVGNPHCVVFTDDLSDQVLHELGPALATHPAFRNGTNVQLAWPAGETAVRIRIWERGVGPTSASGTSSCAVAAAAVRNGLLPPGQLAVFMDGGRFDVEVTERFEVTLRGPVQEVGTGELAPSFCAGLEGWRP